MLFFYEDGCLGMLMDAGGSERIIRSGRLPLVLVQRGCRRLIATDFSSSVLRTISASSGHQALCYDAYGCDGVPEGGELGLGFNGEHYLPLQKMYALGNGERYYSPKLRRFCSPDKSGPFTSAGINGYAYCRGDPVNLIDPSGRTGVPTLQFLAGRKVGLLSGPSKDFNSAMMKRVYNDTLTYGYLVKRLLPKSKDGLNDGMNLSRLLGGETASYFSRAFDKHTKGIVLENPGLAKSVSARAVENVIESIASGLPSNHVFISQTLPTSNQGRPTIGIFYTGMSNAHEVKLQAALGPYKNNIIQTNLPIRSMQPIPQILESLEVKRLLTDMKVIRSIHG